MTSGEIVTHFLAALGSAGPAIGAFISERTKRKTAEAQTTEHVAKAISEATSGLRVTLEMTAGIAKAAMTKAVENEAKLASCEQGREAEQTACAESVVNVRGELAAHRAAEALRAKVTRAEILELQALIADLSRPTTTHPAVVE